MKESRTSITATRYLTPIESSWRVKAVCTGLLFAAGCASSHAQNTPVAAANLPAQNGKSDSEKEQPQSATSFKPETAENNPRHANIGNSQPTPSIKERTVAQTIESQASKGELALLKIEVMSLKEKMAALQRKMDVILKGQRSGLYDDAGLSAVNNQIQNQHAKKNPVPPLGSEGPIDRFENDSDPAERDKAINHEKPDQLVNRATMLLEQREFGKVAQILENFQQRFPNNGLSAAAELTLAEAYVELKSPQQALPHIRTFYLQHPNDVRLIKAKWLEAKTQELLGAPQKASQLFREVIALDPQSQLARRARADLERLNGGMTQ
jgi:TolA-binding protein